MDQINKFKRVEEDQLQEKRNEKVIPQKGRDFRSNRYNNNSPKRDFTGQYGSTNMQKVNTIFKASVHQVLEKIKNESFFNWPNKMARDSMKCN